MARRYDNLYDAKSKFLRELSSALRAMKAYYRGFDDNKIEFIDDLRSKLSDLSSQAYKKKKSDPDSNFLNQALTNLGFSSDLLSGSLDEINDKIQTLDAYPPKFSDRKDRGSDTAGAIEEFFSEFPIENFGEISSVDDKGNVFDSDDGTQRTNSGASLDGWRFDSPYRTAEEATQAYDADLKRIYSKHGIPFIRRQKLIDEAQKRGKFGNLSEELVFEYLKKGGLPHKFDWKNSWGPFTNPGDWFGGHDEDYKYDEEDFRKKYPELSEFLKTKDEKYQTQENQIARFINDGAEQDWKFVDDKLKKQGVSGTLIAMAVPAFKNFITGALKGGGKGLGGFLGAGSGLYKTFNDAMKEGDKEGHQINKNRLQRMRERFNELKASGLVSEDVLNNYIETRKSNLGYDLSLSPDTNDYQGSFDSETGQYSGTGTTDAIDAFTGGSGSGSFLGSGGGSSDGGILSKIFGGHDASPEKIQALLGGIEGGLGEIPEFQNIFGEGGSFRQRDLNPYFQDQTGIDPNDLFQRSGETPEFDPKGQLGDSPEFRNEILFQLNRAKHAKEMHDQKGQIQKGRNQLLDEAREYRDKPSVVDEQLRQNYERELAGIANAMAGRSGPGYLDELENMRNLKLQRMSDEGSVARMQEDLGRQGQYVDTLGKVLGHDANLLNQLSQIYHQGRASDLADYQTKVDAYNKDRGHLRDLFNTETQRYLQEMNLDQQRDLGLLQHKEQMGRLGLGQAQTIAGQDQALINALAKEQATRAGYEQGNWKNRAAYDARLKGLNLNARKLQAILDARNPWSKENLIKNAGKTGAEFFKWAKESGALEKGGDYLKSAWDWFTGLFGGGGDIGGDYPTGTPDLPSEIPGIGDISTIAGSPGDLPGLAGQDGGIGMTGQRGPLQGGGIGMTGQVGPAGPIGMTGQAGPGGPPGPGESYPPRREFNPQTPMATPSNPMRAEYNPSEILGLLPSDAGGGAGMIGQSPAGWQGGGATPNMTNKHGSAQAQMMAQNMQAQAKQAQMQAKNAQAQAKLAQAQEQAQQAQMQAQQMLGRIPDQSWGAGSGQAVGGYNVPNQYMTDIPPWLQGQPNIPQGKLPHESQADYYNRARGVAHPSQPNIPSPNVMHEQTRPRYSHGIDPDRLRGLMGQIPHYPAYKTFVPDEDWGIKSWYGEPTGSWRTQNDDIADGIAPPSPRQINLPYTPANFDWNRALGNLRGAF